MPTIGELGEDALIALFAPHLPRADAELLGPGDDAAVLAVDGDVVVSTDVLVEGRHFRRDWGTAADVGWRAAMQNLADIDAMGAVPTALLVSLTAPADTPAEWVVAFADGLNEACAPHGVGVVGGDLSGGSEIVIAVTVMGETHGVPPVTRADAVPGDLLVVSQPLGGAAAGLAALTAGLDGHDAAVRAFLRPHPRIGAGLEAALSGATAMMDVSDGLLRDVHRLAKASEVLVEIDSHAVPVADAAHEVALALDLNVQQFSLAGGEDHAMVATFSTEPPVGWTVIGRIADGPAGVNVDGAPARPEGWDHFAV
jgi:thiamine-monophosphate kinase